MFFPFNVALLQITIKKINEKWDFFNTISSPKEKESHKETERDDSERMGKGGRDSDRDKEAIGNQTLVCTYLRVMKTLSEFYIFQRRKTVTPSIS